MLLIASCSSPQLASDPVSDVEAELGVKLEASRISVGDIELFVVQAGPTNGPPVLLLHGFPEFWYAWRGPMAELAAAGYRVIVPDQRGYGFSDKPSSVKSYNVERIAEDAAALISALGHESAYVAAHDWGGSVAWQLAMRRPELVRRMVVIDMPHPQAVRTTQENGSSDEDSLSWYVIAFQVPWLPERVVRFRNWRFLVNILKNTSVPGTFSDESIAHYQAAWNGEGAMRGMINWYRAAWRYPPSDPEDWRIKPPTLIVLAPDDAFLPAETTRRSLDWLNNGRLLELTNGSHWVIHERPRQIGKILNDFFDDPAVKE